MPTARVAEPAGASVSMVTMKPAATTAPTALSAPNTTTAVNHSRLLSGENVSASKEEVPSISRAPPSPATTEETVNDSSLRLRTSTPTAAAPSV